MVCAARTLRGVALAAVLLDQPEAAGPDRREVAVARDEGDVLAGQREAGAEVAADGAGADDGDLHIASFLATQMRRGFTRRSMFFRPPHSGQEQQE